MIKNLFKKIFKKKSKKKDKSELNLVIDDKNKHNSQEINNSNISNKKNKLSTYSIHDNQDNISINNDNSNNNSTNSSNIASIISNSNSNLNSNINSNSNSHSNSNANSSCNESRKSFLIKSNNNKLDYIDELIATLNITLDLIKENNQNSFSVVNKVLNVFNKRNSLKKQLSDIKSNLLLLNLVKIENEREYNENKNNLETQYVQLSSLKSNKSQEICFAYDTFAEFEKHISLIRINNHQYSDFYLFDFINTNYKLIVKRNNSLSRIYLLKEAIKNNEEFNIDYKSFSRSIELLKGLSTQDFNGSIKVFNDSLFCDIVSYVDQMKSKISLCESKLLKLSLIYVSFYNN